MNWDDDVIEARHGWAQRQLFPLDFHTFFTESLILSLQKDLDELQFFYLKMTWSPGSSHKSSQVTWISKTVKVKSFLTLLDLPISNSRRIMSLEHSLYVQDSSVCGSFLYFYF